jgi:hypothetical protein
LRRIFIYSVIIAAIGWISFIAYQLLGNQHLNPFELFGKEDSQVLVIHKKNGYKKDLLSFSTIPKNEELLSRLLDIFGDQSRIYVSASRMNILIENKHLPSYSTIIKRLKNAGLKPKEMGSESFKINGFQASVKENGIHFIGSDSETTSMDGWSNMDKKASVSIIAFTDEIAKVKDIYFRGDYKMEFHTKKEKHIQGEQVKDQELFAGILPRSVNDYHFLERNYALSIDPTLRKGPMFEWLDKGFVCITYKGSNVLVSDFKDGQSPIDVLSEKTGQAPLSDDHGYYQKISLSSQFIDKKNTGFHVFILNGYAVISENEQACAELITEQKLGNTLSMDDHALRHIYGDLPAKVSERTSNYKEKYSRSIYSDRLIETHILLKPIDTSKESYTDGETFTIHVDATIRDFIALDGKGNVVVTTATGELINFSNGQTTWIRNLGSKPVGNISYIEEYQLILATSNNSIHLLDRTGRYIFGGPIRIQAEPAQQASYFVWKKQMYVVYPDRSGTLHVYNAKREKAFSLATGIEQPIGPVLGWISQNRPFLSLFNGSEFGMYDAERRGLHRSFSLLGKGISLIYENEIVLYTSENSGIQKITQKGAKSAVRPTMHGQLWRTSYGRSESFVLNKRGKSIDILEESGKFAGTIQTDFEHIVHADVKRIHNRVMVTVVDGVENNVYLYSIKGIRLNNKPLEGSMKALLSSREGKMLMTTVVDQYLIQYEIN